MCRVRGRIVQHLPELTNRAAICAKVLKSFDKR
jgi:hypothetical protein